MKYSLLFLILIISVTASSASSCERRDGQVVEQKTTENNINKNTMSGKIKIKVNSQMSGKRILVDPVLVMGSPVSFINKPFKIGFTPFPLILMSPGK